MNALNRHNVHVFGPSHKQAIVFAHGFGCDQNMWRYVAPQFVHDHQVVLFDHIGAGGSDVSQYTPSRYSTLDAYADDVLAIVRDLGLTQAIFVGHSVSAMIGVLATIKEPERFETLVLIGPSPRYINDGEYVGGFEAHDIESLLDSLETNYLGWSSTMAPVIMGNQDRPELSQELHNSFCQMDPEIAKNFARVTFLADNRDDLPRVRAKTLILQCSADIIAPLEVGHFVQRRIPASTLVLMKATGHCPNLSAPEETVAAIEAVPHLRKICLNLIHASSRNRRKTSTRTRRAGICPSFPTARSSKINGTLLSWLGYQREEFPVPQRVQELLSIGGRIYYETHFAPLLNMQGFVNEISFDLAKKDRQLFPVLATAVQRRSPTGTAIVNRITLFNVTDRRKYEQELLIERRRAEAAALANAELANQLQADIAVRIQTETQLRQQADLSSFAEHIAKQLNEQSTLTTMLEGCISVMTERLHATHATIWILRRRAYAGAAGQFRALQGSGYSYARISADHLMLGRIVRGPAPLDQ